MKKVALRQWLAQYGERVGLGVALVIMLVLALWGLFSSGPNLRPEQIKDTVEQTRNQLQRGEPLPASMSKYLPVTTDSLSANLEGVFTVIPTKALEADKRIGSQVAIVGLVRRNPQVRVPLAPHIASVYIVHTQFRVECEPAQGGKEICYAYVVKPKPGVKTPELKALPGKPNDPRQREMQQRLETFQRMWRGMGGMMGPGAGFGPGGPFGPGFGPGGPLGPGPGGGPIGPFAGGGGGEGSGPGAATPPRGLGTPEVETQYQIEKVPVTESSKYDLAEYLNCREAVLLVAAFPYADQMQEIAEALLLDRRDVPSLFQGFEVEKRVFALGDRLRGVPDELIIWDRQTNHVRRVAYTEDLPGKEELGWLPVNVQAVALQVASAVEFEQETNPLWLILLRHSKNLAMRLPKMLGSGYYPWKKLAEDYPEIQKTIKQIQDNQKLYEKPPPVDERLKPNIQGVFEGSEAPERSGAPVGGGGEADDAGMGRLPGAGLGGGPALGPLTPRVGGASGTGAAGPRTPSPDAGNQPGAAPAPVIYNGWPDYCIIRFLDVFDREADLRFSPFFSGGRPIAVQYRVRVLLSNPNFGRPKEVQRPEMANKRILEGAWSPPSALLPLSRETAIYAVARDLTVTRDRPADVVPLQVHRWLGIILELTKRDRPAVGDWVVGSVWVGRGEFIGMYAKLPLALWAPHVPADSAAGGGEGGGVGAGVARRFGRFVYVPDVETHAFATHSILVDFENRLTWNDFIRWKVTGSLAAPPELTPQEVLILTEDGRLIARNAQRDLADPERQKREKAWQGRLEEAKKATQPSKPTGGNLFGGS